MPAPLAAIESPRSLAPGTELAAEQPRNFHFAVTWVTLFSHLDPIESTHRRPRPVPPASAPLSIIVAPPKLVEQPAVEPDPEETWEMVVPRMIRTGPRTFVPAEAERKRLL